VTGRDRKLLLALAVLTLAWSVLDASLGLHTGVSHLAPFLLLLVPLLAGRYVGERRLAQLVAFVQRRRHLPVRSRRPAVGGPVVWMARGSELLGRSLAVRPPPPLVVLL